MQGEFKDEYGWIAVVSIVGGIVVGFVVNPAYTIPVMVIVFLILFFSVSD